MEQFYAKTKDGDLLKATIDYDNDPEPPRETGVALGTMFIEVFLDETNQNATSTPYLYEFIRGQLEKSGREDEVIAIEEKADFSTRKGNNIATNKLYDMWEKELCAVVPIYHYNHSGDTINATGWVEVERISGMIYTKWDNPEIKEMLKNKSKEETQKWAENVLRGEIKDYDNYLIGNVYETTVEVFDKYKMQWGSNPNRTFSVYPDNTVSYNERSLKLAQKAIADTGFLSGTYDFISEEEAQKITMTPSAEYKKAVGEEYIKEIKDSLYKFGGNVIYAREAITMLYRKSGNKMMISSLGSYLADNGCTTEGKTVDFINKQLGIKEQDKVQLHAGQSGCTTLIARDRYNQTRGGIVIDYKNKNFAMWQGQGDSAYLGATYSDGTITKAVSWKECVKKGQEMLRCGFREGENHVPHAQITLEAASKTIRYKEQGRER